MSLSPPSPPNPYTTASAQEQINKNSAIYQQQVNDVNQTTPYGSLTYSQSGMGANGIPIMTANTQYNPQVQSLFNTMLSNQQGAGNIASDILTKQGNAMSTPPNLGTTALTNQMMQWGQQYMQPIFNQQQSNLDSQLAAQGVTQGSAAYDNAQNLQSRNVNNAYENLFMQAEPTAYSQALSSYELPFQNVASLMGLSQPQSSVSGSLTQTPQSQIQPANLESQVQADYQSQLSNYQNNIAGMFGLGSAALGGLARAIPFGSDRRIKENIERVGTLDNGLPIYIFNFKKDPDGVAQIGLMAQDVEKVHPEAVTEINGVKHVYYSKAVK